MENEDSIVIVSLIMQGSIVHVQGDEFWHMIKVLRLSTNDRYAHLWPDLFFSPYSRILLGTKIMACIPGLSFVFIFNRLLS